MWDHVIDEGAGKIRCKFCNRVFSGCTITRVKYHLAKITSKDISPCVGIPDWAKEQALKSIGDIEAKSKRQKIADFWKPASSSGSSPSMVSSTLHSTSVATTGELTQPTISSMLRKVEKEETDKAIVNCIVANNLSFNLLRTEEFKRACKAISEAGPGYQLPSSETARTRLLDVLKQDVDAYVESVKQSWSHSGCSLMSDAWTDARGRPHINLLASSPRGTVFLKSECTVGKKKSGDFIFKFICDTIEEIGPMNVVQFISDNASNYISAGYKLVERYGHIFKINCAAHCINLMFKEMDELSFVTPILEDAKKIVKFLYKHQFVTDLMHSFIGNRELKKPCATRFASNFLSLQSILHEDKGLQYLVASSEWRDSPICRSDEGNEVKVIIQGNIFWESGKQIINTIEPLVRVMRIVDGNGSTLGYIYDALDRAKEKIKVLQNDPEKYEPFCKIIDDRWNKSLHSDLHAAAAYLNPQFHYKGIVTMDGEVKEGLENVVMKTIVELADSKTIISELRIYHQMDRDKLFTPLAVEALKDYHPKENGQDVKGEAASDSTEKLVFATPEPIREDQVENAVKFLSHPRVKGSPIIYRRSFLEKKGLTKEEIDEAFRRVPDSSPNVVNEVAATTNPAPQTKASTTVQLQAPIQTPQPAATLVSGPSTVPLLQPIKFQWSHALFAAALLGSCGAGTAVLFKKIVIPRLKACIREVVAGKKESEKDAKSVPNLAEEAAEAAKAAASAAAIVAKASQELLSARNEEKKYFEGFMSMMDVQVKEMKSMGEAIRRLDARRDTNSQEKLKAESNHSITGNGTSNNIWRSPPQNQWEDGLFSMASKQVQVNGTRHADLGAVQPSLAPVSTEPITAPHPKSYMEIMAMIERGEKPPGIKEVNDMPPNPNQAPSKSLLAPKPKPWEVASQRPTYSFQSMSSGDEWGSDAYDPDDIGGWLKRKNVRITEIEPEGEQPKQLAYNGGMNERAIPKVWVPPQPPSVVMPGAVAAIRQPKLAVQKQQPGNESSTMNSDDGEGVVKVMESAVTAPVMDSKHAEMQGGPFTYSKHAEMQVAPSMYSKQAETLSAPVTGSSQAKEHGTPVVDSNLAEMQVAPIIDSSQTDMQVSPVTDPNQADWQVERADGVEVN